MSKTILIAIGGNAIKKAREKGTIEQQLRNIQRTCRHIVQIIKKGSKVVITHGNGPQAGNLLIQQESGSQIVVPQPLDVVGAMTQGQIGYMLQQTLINCLRKAKLNIPVVTVLTQMIVDKDDSDFNNPEKPIGPFYTKQEAERLDKRKGYMIKKVKSFGGRSYRRVVPSPDPKAIVEKDTIRRLLDANVIIIACGGGGIPVINQNGNLVGVEAVIDKDLAGEKLAEAVGAEIFLILTDIEKVKINYGTPDQEDIDKMTLVEAKNFLQEGHFLPGSMKPKISACIRFLEAGGEKAVITSIESAVKALEGKTGTLILKNE